MKYRITEKAKKIQKKEGRRGAREKKGKVNGVFIKRERTEKQKCLCFSVRKQLERRITGWFFFFFYCVLMILFDEKRRLPWILMKWT